MQNPVKQKQRHYSVTHSISTNVSAINMAPHHKEVVPAICLPPHQPSLNPHQHRLLPHLGCVAVQVSLDAPVPSIAALAMHKWLQDLHSKVQIEGPSYIPKRVVLLVGLWVGTPGPQTSPQAPARVETSPLEPLEEKRAGPSQSDAQASAQALSREPAAAAAAPAAATAGSDEPGPSSATVPTESSSRSAHLGQKRTAPGLPTVAAKVFGPEYTAAANQAAVLGMVRGFALPFTVADESDGLRLEADGAAVAEWLQAEGYEAVMADFAPPLTSPVDGMPVLTFIYLLVFLSWPALGSSAQLVCRITPDCMLAACCLRLLFQTVLW